MKIINPAKKSEAMLRQLHHFDTKFASAMAIRIKLIENFKELVPDSVSFEAGYYEGSKHAKVWVVTDDDVGGMYKKYPNGGEITLWCEGRGGDKEASKKRKRDKEEAATSWREENEDDVRENLEILKEKYAKTGQYNMTQLHLWARMVVSGQHSSLEKAPDNQAFGGTVAKKSRRSYIEEAVSGAVSGAAATFASAFNPKRPDSEPDHAPTHSSSTSLSLGKVLELRMKNMEQLRYLQNLRTDNILSEEEYSEQKQAILAALKKL